MNKKKFAVGAMISIKGLEITEMPQNDHQKRI
jgi:hypothetical protein